MIKAIAVDMDGTFLNSNNDYDGKAFLELFKKLKAKEVRFVVASGNQYAQISSFFSRNLGRNNICFRKWRTRI